MFGKNEITKPFTHEDGRLLVNELFYTIQGEGPDAGRPAIFLRLSKCNLRCYFCDTQFEKGEWITAHSLMDRIGRMSVINGCPLVVITGGEPLLQNIVPLTRSLNECGISVSVETAGTTYYPELVDVFSPVRAIAGNLIVCSPKTGKVNSDIEPLVGAWKYIIKSGHTSVLGIPDKSTQLPGQDAAIFLPRDRTVPIYVQAMDEYDDVLNAGNLIEAAAIAMKHGYRLSVQIHKLADLR